jgi:hypothetical protein
MEKTLAVNPQRNVENSADFFPLFFSAFENYILIPGSHHHQSISLFPSRKSPDRPIFCP